MTNAYRLYERLGEKEGESGELSALALSIARDVHEVKKDNLRIIRGIEGEVEEVYDQEQMEFQDLMHILENSTRRMLGENRASIRLECRRTADFSTQEHYRLLSILKNLVTNAIEAIQGAGGRGSCWWRSGWRVTLCFSPCQTTAPASRSAPCTICSRWAIPPNLTRRPATSTGAWACPQSSR